MIGEQRFPMMEGRELVCRCGRRHCSPACEACRVHGITRCHPRPDYNRTTVR